MGVTIRGPQEHVAQLDYLYLGAGVANGTLEKPSRSGGIAALCQQETMGLAITVDRTVKIRPLAATLDAGFITAVGQGSRPISCLGICSEQRFNFA